MEILWKLVAIAEEGGPVFFAILLLFFVFFLIAKKLISVHYEMAEPENFYGKKGTINLPGLPKK